LIKDKRIKTKIDGKWKDGRKYNLNAEELKIVLELMNMNANKYHTDGIDEKLFNFCGLKKEKALDERFMF
jgi:hypothetical protein